MQKVNDIMFKLNGSLSEKQGQKLQRLNGHVVDGPLKVVPDIHSILGGAGDGNEDFVERHSGTPTGQPSPRTVGETKEGLSVVDTNIQTVNIADQSPTTPLNAVNTNVNRSKASASAIGVVDTNRTVRDTRTFAETTEDLNIVVNLSSRLLTQEEKVVLSKGLKFCPTPTDIDMYEVRRDINEFLRRIRLREYFYNDDDDVEGDISEDP